MLIRTFIVSLLSSISIISAGQPKQQYLFFHLGSRNGLVSNEVMGVQQDSKGYIWIATLNGLQRYDGHRLLTFNHVPGDPHSLPNDAVSYLYLDKKDRLWMKCNENRIGYFNVSDFTFHETPVHYPEMRLRDEESGLMKDDNDRLILILHRNTVLTYDDVSGTFDSIYNPFRLPANWGPLSVMRDPVTHDYWIGCDSGLVKYSVNEKLMSYRGHNTSKDPIIDALSHATYTAIPYRDRSNHFWLLSWPYGPIHFYRYDIATKKLDDLEPELATTLSNYHETIGIKEQRDGAMWIFGAGVFVKFNEQKRKFEWVEPDVSGEFSIRYDAVRNVFEDRENNLWVSTNKGLYRFNPAGQFLHLVLNRRPNEKQDLTADVSDILQLKNGDIIVATWGRAIFAYDKDFNPVKRDYVDQGIQLQEGMDWCIYERANGDIWRGNQGGYLFIYYAAKKKSVRLLPPVFQNSTIRQITEDKDHNLWLSTQSGHLVKWNAATDSFTLMHKFGSIAYRLYTDRQGDLWVCTRSNGVFHINPKDGKIIHNYTADAPKGERLMLTSCSDIIQYDDSLYLMASGGLNILNIRTNKFRYVTSENVLPSNTVKNIVADRQGRIWLTVESGLCSFNIQKKIISDYNENDGLPIVNFNEAATCILNDGRIAMGTSRDIVLFDPGYAYQMDLSPPPVNISGFVMMNKALKVDSLLHLPRVSLKHTNNSIIIQLSTMTYQNNFGISYMLEGMDKDWLRKNTAQSQAVYSYLPPGRYTFKVRCENGEGIYSKTTEFKIVVEPPFWQTWWFFCALALFVIAVVYWLDKQRINKMIALQTVRSEIAGNLHDEVNTTLNNINLLSEMARIKVDKEIGRSKEYIEQISSKSHNMILAMDDILWSIDPANDKMEKTLLRMSEFADVLKSLYGASIEIALDKKVRALKPDMKTRHETFLIFKRALNMIMQYSGGRNTLVHIDLFKNKIAIKMQDATATLDNNSSEIDATIKDMHERASIIGADLDVQQDRNGIIIILLVPVK